MRSVYNKARSEAVVSGTRSAINKACTSLGAQAILVDLNDDSCVDGGEAVGPDKRTVVRLRFCPFCALKESLPPSIVLPNRDNGPSCFLGIPGRRVRRLELSGS